MKIAVVTPCYRPRAEWLEQCLQSVRRQTVPCTHLLVNDGDPELSVAADDRLRLLRVPGPHQDTGNVARAIGSFYAASQGFEAVAYLDADNWYEPHHLASLAGLHQQSEALVCSSGRKLFHLNGSYLGVCPEVDGRNFVDTNCLFLTRGAFGLLPAWYQVSAAEKLLADRHVWRKVQRLGLSRAHTGQSSVAYRTGYKVHYQLFGLEPPAEAKLLLWDPQQRCWVHRS